MSRIHPPNKKYIDLTPDGFRYRAERRKRNLQFISVLVALAFIFISTVFHLNIQSRASGYVNIISTAQRHQDLNSRYLTRYISSDGNLISSTVRNNFHNRDREKLAEFPELLIKLVTLSEDKGFFGNDDPLFLLGKSIIRTVVTGGRAGGSGINNQLARTIVPLGNGKSLPDKIFRKFDEIAVSEALKQYYRKQYGSHYKEAILNTYLNQVFLGTNVYGFQDAARVYYNREIQKLSFAKQATLVAMLSRPNAYLCISDPREQVRQFQKLGRLRDRLLDKAVDEGFITPAQAKVAKREQINLSTDRCEAIYESPHFTDYIAVKVKEVAASNSQVRNAQKNGNLSVQTTLNLALQHKAESTLARTVKIYGKYGIDMGAILVEQTSTGSVSTMAIKNDDPDNYQFNLIIDAKRMPASTYKLFTYLAALESKKSFSWDYLSSGVALSINDTAKDIARKVGMRKVSEMISRMGIRTDKIPDEGTILGQNKALASLLEMTEAYRVVANGGVKTDLRTIDYLFSTNSCLDPEKFNRCKILYKPRVSRPDRLLSPNVAAQMTKLLMGVVDRPNATGRLAYIPGVAISGKTGTNGVDNNARDLWFIGFSPSHNLTIGVWLGASKEHTIRSKDLGTAIGGNLAAQVWRQTLQSAMPRK
jgi:penicillin-binding protein 1A